MAHACNSNTWETENKGLEFRPQISLGYLVSGTVYEKNMRKENIGRKEEKKGGRKEGKERKDGGRFGEQVF